MRKSFPFLFAMATLFAITAKCSSDTAKEKRPALQATTPKEYFLSAGDQDHNPIWVTGLRSNKHYDADGDEEKIFIRIKEKGWKVDHITFASGLREIKLIKRK